MRALAASLLATLLAVGCLGPEERPAVETAAAPSAGPDAASEDPTPAPVAGTSIAPTVDEPTATTLAWDGSTASAVCAVVHCQILQQPTSSWSPFSTLGVPGRAVRATGTLTWEPASPLTEELHVFVFSLDESGMVVDGAQITGPSPLAFDVDLSGWTGVDFAYSLHGHHSAGNDAVILETAQPFHMETTILSLQP